MPNRSRLLTGMAALWLAAALPVLAQDRGGLREAIFHPDDLFGIRLALTQYSAPSMIDAIREKPRS